MECGQIEKMLPEYAEEALAPEEIARIEKHLTSCAKCRMALDDYKKAQELVKGLEEVEPPPGFAQKIMVQVREEAREKGGLLQRLFYPLHVKLPIQAIATVVIAVLAIQVYRSVEPQKAAVQAPQVSTPAVSAPVAPKEEPRQERKEEIVSSPAREAPRAAEDVQVSRERRSKDKAAEPPLTPAPVKTHLQEDKTPTTPFQAPKREEVAREAERSEAVLAPKKAQMEPKTAAPHPALGTASLRKADLINLRMRVNDIAAAGQAVATILGDLGGGNIERVPGEGREVVTANLQTQRLKEFLEKLGSVGETEEKAIPSGISEAFVALRIEILKK
jgi:hypothetical protein